jgi:GntR family transcriptional regulator, galactonate operon transcriptional repressor
LSHRYPGAGLHGRIVHSIGRRIVTGDIRPGELLPTPALVRDRSGVVREAFKVLAAKGRGDRRWCDRGADPQARP